MALLDVEPLAVAMLHSNVQAFYSCFLQLRCTVMKNKIPRILFVDDDDDIRFIVKTCLVGTAMKSLPPRTLRAAYSWHRAKHLTFTCSTRY